MLIRANKVAFLKNCMVARRCAKKLDEGGDDDVKGCWDCLNVWKLMMSEKCLAL